MAENGSPGVRIRRNKGVPRGQGTQPAVGMSSRSSVMVDTSSWSSAIVLRPDECFEQTRMSGSSSLAAAINSQPPCSCG
jgi:hypothetical protein